VLPEIARRFTAAIRDAAARAAGLDPGCLTDLGGFEAHVFRGAGRILKVTHTLRRTPDALLGEAELVQHLWDAGVPVARPLAMADGGLLGRIPDGEGGLFLAVCTEAIDGRRTGPADWDAGTVSAWGATAGAMARAGRSFHPSQAARQRRHWTADPIVDFARSIPDSAPELRARGLACLARLSALPTGPSDEGLAHADLHHGNFLLDADGRVRPFDFDDCEVSPFVREVAVPLYYAVAAVGKQAGDAERRAFAGFFLRTFLAAFVRAQPLSARALASLPDWLEMRSCILFAALQETAATGDLTAEARAAALRRIRDRLDQGPAWTGLDFGALAQELGT
jgi:amicoumacin kinase